jgi:hypothetical protein
VQHLLLKELQRSWLAADAASLIAGSGSAGGAGTGSIPTAATCCSSNRSSGTTTTITTGSYNSSSSSTSGISTSAVVAPACTGVASAPAGEADASPAKAAAVGAAGPVSTAASSSSSSSVHVTSTPQFAEALKYVVDRGTAAVPSMFWEPGSSSGYGSSSSSRDPAPALRGRILECIRPGADGSLLGYTPLPAFRQTYAKGWAKGPQGDCRVSGQAPES